MRFSRNFIHVLDTALLFLRCGEISIDRLLLAIIHTSWVFSWSRKCSVGNISQLLFSFAEYMINELNIYVFSLYFNFLSIDDSTENFIF